MAPATSAVRRQQFSSQRTAVENQWPTEPADPTLYAMEEPQHRIRAAYSESTVTVYQAYSPEIGLPAVRDGRFPAAWKRDRMTWVYPSGSRTTTFQADSPAAGAAIRAPDAKCAPRSRGGAPQLPVNRGRLAIQRDV